MSSQTPHTPTTPSSTCPSSNDTNRMNNPIANNNNNNKTNTTLQFRRKLSHLSYPLAPLLSITSGISHPQFPTTILAYHLLTEQQLDELAHWYHQRTPGEWSFYYPLPVVDRWWISSTRGDGNGRPGIEDKRRRFGRFVGLGGCESPVVSGRVGDERNGGEDEDKEREREREREREQRAMELWVEGQMKMREEKAERELMAGRKGC
ncbi:MAG: hypothetical protein L6R37_003792 [Teloschistes peruensis]|nr:MAG: hypothetical protein L6R37_003792 [Teloschistes peruensis]